MSQGTPHDEQYWADRREHPRFETRMKCTVREGVEPALTAVMMRNLSLGGCFVLSSEPMPERTILELCLAMPELDRTLRVQGEVAWQKLGAPGSGMGVRFRIVEPDDLDVLRIYLRELAKEAELEG